MFVFKHFFIFSFLQRKRKNNTNEEKKIFILCTKNKRKKCLNSLAHGNPMNPSSFLDSSLGRP